MLTWSIVTGGFLLLILLYFFYRLPPAEVIYKMFSKDSPITGIEISTIFGNRRIIKMRHTMESPEIKQSITELIEIKCPITDAKINTFHLAPSPSSSSDDLLPLKVGEDITEGQSLCAIEFTMDNKIQIIEIKAEKSGKISKIHAENESKVSAGQTLLFYRSSILKPILM